LKLWSVIRWYGAEGLRAHIRKGVALAQELASWISADPGFEVHEPHPLGLVCFRPVWPGLAADEADRATLELLNAVRRGSAPRAPTRSWPAGP
jgi:aromatic-L-amino-acid decarboxylase